MKLLIIALFVPVAIKSAVIPSLLTSEKVLNNLSRSKRETTYREIFYECSMRCPRYTDRNSGLKECKISCTANGRPTPYEETGISMTSDLDYNTYRIIDKYTGQEISWDANRDQNNHRDKR